MLLAHQHEVVKTEDVCIWKIPDADLQLDLQFVRVTMHHHESCCSRLEGTRDRFSVFYSISFMASIHRCVDLMQICHVESYFPLHKVEASCNGSQQ